MQVALRAQVVRAVVAGVLLIHAIGGAPASAGTLCRKRSGLVALREACLPSETAIDPRALVPDCPPDSTRVGTICVDTYEASVWHIFFDSRLVDEFRLGTATTVTLGEAGMASPIGVVGLWTDSVCRRGAMDCEGDLYAASIAGVPPSEVTWFQAQQACANVGKRLLTNAEWQMAAAGTPEALCNLSLEPEADPTGTPGCVSRWGVYDMVGNASEWVAEWLALPSRCAEWPGISDDLMCLTAVPEDPPAPGALIRGGDRRNGTAGGIFAVLGSPPTSRSGFRCAR